MLPGILLVNASRSWCCKMIHMLALAIPNNETVAFEKDTDYLNPLPFSSTPLQLLLPLGTGVNLSCTEITHRSNFPVLGQLERFNSIRSASSSQPCPGMCTPHDNVGGNRQCCGRYQGRLWDRLSFSVTQKRCASHQAAKDEHA